MKAIAKTRPEPGMEIIDVPVPKPGPNQILVKIAACGICGSDLHIYLWELGADRALPGMPAVIGHEPAGEVVELGTTPDAIVSVLPTPFTPGGPTRPLRRGYQHVRWFIRSRRDPDRA